jgi:O-antigen/teichoic acid export membrane protein
MKTLVRAVVQTFISSVVVQVLTALVGILLARHLGPTGRGELAAVLLWNPILLTLLHLGFGSAIQFFYAQLSERERLAMFGNGLLLALVVGLPGAALTWFLLPTLLHAQPPSVVLLARVYALHLPLGMVADYSSSLLLATRSFGRVNFLRVLNPILYLSGLGALALTGQLSIVSIFLAQLISGNISLVVTLFQVKKAGALSLRTDLALLRRCLGYALRTHLGNLCSLTSGQGDRMLMAAFLPSRDLGLYSVAVSTTMLAWPLVGAITTTLLPTVAGEAEPERRQTALRVSRLSLPLLVLLYGSLFLVAKPLILFMFGPAFADSVLAARILTLGTVAFGAADILRQALRALGRPILASAGDIAGLISTVGLLALLLPSRGFIGAAYASLGAYVLTYAVLLACAVIMVGTPLAELVLPTAADLGVLWGACRGLLSRHRRPVQLDTQTEVTATPEAFGMRAQSEGEQSTCENCGSC